MQSLETVVVTRHKALLQHLLETGVVTAEQGASCIEHATAENVAGKIVIGVLPIHLQAICAVFISVPLEIPAELRGVELNIEQVRQFAQAPAFFVTTKVRDLGAALLVRAAIDQC